MEPSVKIIEKVEKVKDGIDLNNEESIIKIIEDKFLDSQKFSKSYLDYGWTEKEKRLVEDKINLDELKDKLIAIEKTIMDLKYFIENSRPPKLFGKKKYEIKVDNSKKEFEEKKQEENNISLEIKEFKDIISKNREIMDKIEERKINISKQYEFDEEYFYSSISDFKNKIYESLVPKVPEDIMITENINKKIELLKNIARKYEKRLHILSLISWDKCLDFVKLTVYINSHVDNNEFYIIENKSQLLKVFCMTVIFEFIDGSGDKYLDEIIYWECKLIKYLFIFEDKEITKEISKMNNMDKDELKGYLWSFFKFPSKLKSTLKEILQSINEQKRIAIELRDETALKNITTVEEDLLKNTDIGFFKKYVAK